MLPKRSRLSAAEVREVIARGRSLRAGTLALKYLPESSVLRAAVVVSKKVARTAVTRNRLRRVTYQTLRSLPFHGRVVVFIQKIPPAPLTQSIGSQLTELSKKISIS